MVSNHKANSFEVFYIFLYVQLKNTSSVFHDIYASYIITLVVKTKNQNIFSSNTGKTIKNLSNHGVKFL